MPLVGGRAACVGPRQVGLEESAAAGATAIYPASSHLFLLGVNSTSRVSPLNTTDDTVTDTVTYSLVSVSYATCVYTEE